MKDLKPMGVKGPLGLLPLRPLEAIAAVFEHGAAKYSPWNWQDDSQPQARMDELVNAALRHGHAVTDPSQGEIDEESGLPHMAHMAACAIIWLYKNNHTYYPSKFVVAKQMENATWSPGEEEV